VGADSIPLNFLHPIPGTQLAGSRRLNPRYCLKTLALFRFANPDREIRIAAGRELHLGALQPLGLYPANSLFVGDYLTTPGQPPQMDYQMIEDLGFVVTHGDDLAAADPILQAAPRNVNKPPDGQPRTPNDR
jgi:biotin synthase